MEMNTYFYIHADCGEKTGKPALLVRLYCYNAGRAKCKDFVLFKVLVLSFQFLQVGKRCQFCRNKLNIGKKRLFSSVVMAMVFAIRDVKHRFHCTGRRIVRKFREFCIHFTFM